MSARCRTDRKSTRLNSSHLVISYAVFCLKKKIRKERGLSSLVQYIIILVRIIYFSYTRCYVSFSLSYVSRLAFFPFISLNFFFFNDTATTEIYTLSLHDALPISEAHVRGRGRVPARPGQCGSHPAP